MRPIIFILLIHALWYNCAGQRCIEATYTSQIGVREATNHNDGKDVEKYLHSVKMGPGYAWCAAFVKWCLEQCGVVTPISAWAPSAYNKDNPIFKDKKWIAQPRAGDVFTIYSYSLKRVAHTGFFHRLRGDNAVETVEGNTNDNGSREGNGVYRRTRPLYSIHNISRWD